ncbi:hypothetical protein [Bacillus toyonensis]|uniref:hypothetical protein n=1 Tax=Bacillus toyonensis TaxID=155322 RepID=UPI0023783BBE|nr:hypothetical protein [Bacillus toyonensis]MDD9265145.1 hypothetical protein [Bacillus toyonensis]
MYKEHNIQGLSQLSSSEIYFILKWGEIFHNVPLNYRTTTSLCTRSLLKESIEVLRLANLDILKEYNVTNILGTLTASIKSDEILSAHFKKDYDYLLKQISRVSPSEARMQDANSTPTKMKNKGKNIYLHSIGELFRNLLNVSQGKLNVDQKLPTKENKNPEKDKQRNILLILLQSLLNKMESTNILSIYVDFLKNKLSKSKYGEIDRYISLLVGELLHEGHSKQYLYEWGQGILVSNSSSFGERLVELLQLGDKKTKQYECIFQLSISEISSDFPIYDAKGTVVFIELPKVELQRLKTATGLNNIVGIGDFFNTDRQLARVKVNAVDEYAAVNLAKRSLIDITKIFNLYSKYTTFDPTLNKYVIIHACSEKKVTLFHDRMKQNVLTLGEAPKLFEIKTFGPNLDTYQGLDQLLQWCRVVQESPVETSIVAMWSMLEFLFASDEKDKFGSVHKYAKAYVTHFYGKSLLDRTNRILSRDTVKYQSLRTAVNTYKNNSETTIGTGGKYMQIDWLFEYITKNSSSAQSIYQGDTIAQRYISLIELLTKHKKDKGPTRIWLFHLLKEMEQQVTRDLQRAYRVRNILTHQALAEGDHLDDIYNKLIFYTQIILNNVIYSMKKQPKNTIEQLNQLKLITYEEYLQGIENHVTKPLSFNELISNDILYV